ncbi:23S rRNA (pseudouridine(1915)-N(3))-methyltransferase RlmH [Mycoplasmopsis felifaucium]|uniref:23S rRNA (pseudouridine(1915)-N(3))-methyltransferase RlmH n=1 Tax=Mycoplasmopsis felifaucium TaxID=35768 RepID=UPI0004890388|nr:23S rRNA (pseudouridine(1915)-N(3))-methyltransferase RlmH [Mycoplasmopsis felifaucium]
MTRIRLIAVGSLNPKFKALYDEYTKNINHFCEFSQVELKECSEEKNIELKKDKETKLIVDKILPNSYVILTDLTGKLLDSIELSKILYDNQNKDITLIIGGSDGVNEQLINYNLKLCFSKLTFPHQLFRIMLAEQIYRGYTILNNKKYHK